MCLSGLKIKAEKTKHMFALSLNAPQRRGKTPPNVCSGHDGEASALEIWNVECFFIVIARGPTDWEW